MAKSQTCYYIYQRRYKSLTDVNYDNNKHICKNPGLVITVYNSHWPNFFYYSII